MVPESSGRCIDVDENSTIVFLNYPNQAFLAGAVKVKAIRGTIQIFGYDLTPDKPPVPVYSFKELNTLKVMSVNDGKSETDASFFQSLNILRKKIDQITAESECYSHVFVVLKNETDNLISYLGNSEFPLSNDSDRMVRLFSEGKDNVLMESSEWHELADKFSRAPRKVVICGGGCVGKSTFLRYLANRCLAQWDRILVLDFDPGQSEFTVMGCLSACLVQRPLLGPNFSHIRTPEKSIYIGDTSPTSCASLYSEGVKTLVNFCDRCFNHEDIPWIVNTMGFPRGLGIKLIAQIMDVIRPTDVVQIVSGKDKNNFPVHLTPEFLNLENMNQIEKTRWKPHLHLLPSLSEGYDVDHVSFKVAAVKRNVVTMCYFRSTMTNDDADLSSVTPKKRRVADLQIVINKPTSKEIVMAMTVAQKLCCVNANLVALCYGEDTDRLDCLGFGIVRGFDIQSDEIYLITPVAEEVLERVTVIKMSSSIQLPLVFYQKHAIKFKGHYPYMIPKTEERLNQPVKKTSSRVKYV